MKPKRVDPMTGVIRFLGTMRDGLLEAPHRRDVFTTELGTHLIDTCCPLDTKLWETGIRPKDEKWIIVEQYGDRTEAGEGHARWVRKLTENPKLQLKDIDLWSLHTGKGEGNEKGD